MSQVTQPLRLGFPNNKMGRRGLPHLTQGTVRQARPRWVGFSRGESTALTHRKWLPWPWPCHRRGVAPGPPGSVLWAEPSSHWPSPAPFSRRQMSTRTRGSQVGFGAQLRGKLRHYSGIPRPHGLRDQDGETRHLCPSRAWCHAHLPSLRGHRFYSWLLSHVSESPRPQISAPPKDLRGRWNRNRLPLPSKYSAPSRAKRDGQCFLTVLGR